MIQTNFKTKLLLLAIILAGGFFAGCQKETPEPEITEEVTTEDNTVEKPAFDFSPFYLLIDYSSTNCSSCYAGNLIINQMRANTAENEKVINIYRAIAYWDGLFGGLPDPHSTPSNSSEFLGIVKYITPTRIKSYQNAVPPMLFTPMMIVGAAEQQLLVSSTVFQQHVYELKNVSLSHSPNHAVVMYEFSYDASAHTLTGLYSIRDKNDTYSLPEEKMNLIITLAESDLSTYSKYGENAGRTHERNHVDRADVTIELEADENGDGTFTISDIPEDVVIENTSIIGYVYEAYSNALNQFGPIYAAHEVEYEAEIAGN